ncbi:MAG: hypothetical protein KGQ46_12550 [Hyphomicrobiales bacterium]|nr:hypothetical protein [Hyphomicrobiales bacterium]MDE2113809.1 hypothetical protein [Hyphomicrobiales bacterium]
MAHPTPFNLLVKHAGLSLTEASLYLATPLDTVKSWSTGRSPAPAGALEHLGTLITRQILAAQDILVTQAGADKIMIECPASFDEAVAMGWPCHGAFVAMAARVIAAAPVTTGFIDYQPAC